MPLTPAEAIAQNEGKKNVQFERAIQVLSTEIDEAISYYTGNPVYVGLPAYLQYKAQADLALKNGQQTLEAVDQLLDERFSPYGWRVSMVTTESKAYFWAKLVDSRKS